MPIVKSNAAMSAAFEQDLRKFLMNTSMRADWLEDSVIRVYVRKSYRRVAGEYCWTFDIANVSVAELVQNCGYFRALIQLVERLVPEVRPDLQGIYIENAQSERFRDGLIRMGFDAVSSSGAQEGVKDCFFSPMPIEVLHVR